MNQTHLFIEISSRRGPHKFLVQCGPPKKHVLNWFELYNPKLDLHPIYFRIFYIYVFISFGIFFRV